MANVLVESDVFIDHLRMHRDMRPRGHRLHYSSITRAELFAGGDEATIGRLLEPFLEIPMDRAIAERAGRLRRTLELELPDAVIAATALERRLQLLTRNVRDFERVPRLRVRSEL